MKTYITAATLLFISFFLINTAVAECPDGMAELVIVTPSGISKTICVPDSAIPGLESAADHSPQAIVEAECPCLDVWDGPPYPDGTVVTGVPPVLPADLSSYQCDWTLSPAPATTVFGRILDEVIYSASDIEIPDSSVCRASNWARTNQAELQTLPSVFTEEVTPDSEIQDIRLGACLRLLESRGCPNID